MPRKADKYLHFDATVDGVRLNGLDKNYAISKIYDITVPKDNFGDLTPGQWKAVMVMVILGAYLELMR